MMAGASGAIAACIGAFAWRCASRRIRMAYWIGWYWRGTFLIPAWIWAGAWFLIEVLSFVTHSSGGVAVMAHIGGFLFGFAGAVALEKSGFEAQKLAPAVSAATTWEQHAGIDAARAALERSDGVAASAAYREAPRERPGARGAPVGGAKPAHAPAKGEPPIDEARRHVAAARALPAIAPEMRQQIEALAAQVGAVEPLPSPQAAQPPAPVSAVRILACKLLKLDENSLQVESTTGLQRNVELQ